MRCTFHMKAMALDFVGFLGLVSETPGIRRADLWVFFNLAAYLGEREVPSVAMWLMLLHCAKMWRFVFPTVVVLPDSRADSYARGVMSSFLWLVFLSHAAAVGLLVLAVQERAAGSPSITSVGYGRLGENQGQGDVLLSPAERAINSILLILGQLFVAKVCADVTWLTSLHNLEETKCPKTSLSEPGPQRSERVLAYQSFVQHVHREEDLDQPAFHGLSAPLMQELRLAAYRKLILKAPFLREQKKHVISMMVSSLSDLIYLPADFIVCSGDTGRELFFMRRGIAGVYPSGPECPPVWGESSEVAEYTAGKYFGELGMLTARPRAAWIMAKTYCVLSVLPYQTVELLRDQHPEAFTTLVQSMVRVFKLEPSTTWSNVAVRLLRKVPLATTDEAFDWFCEQGDGDPIGSEEPLLKAKSFEWVLKFLGVNDADRMILWAEMDADNTGHVSRQEFEEKMDIEFAAEKVAKSVSSQQAAASLLRSNSVHFRESGMSTTSPRHSEPRFTRSVSRDGESQERMEGPLKEEMMELLRDTVRTIAEEHYAGPMRRMSNTQSGRSPRNSGPRPMPISHQSSS
ncbi:unnamed protein product [Effrenium voratum]|nr:unnamed protein product [Effrenium voratum]